MRRRVTAGSEVVKRGHEAAAKQMAPNTIDGHPRGEWIGWVHEPSSQIQAVGPGAAGSERMQYRGRAGLHRVAAPEEISANMDARVTRLFFLNENGRGGFGLLLFLRGVTGRRSGRAGRFDVLFRSVIEKRIELVEFALGEGIVFVVMTLGASEREAQPDRRGRVHPVDHG